MLDWVLNTPLSIALSLEKKVKLNLDTFNRRPHHVLKTSSEGTENAWECLLKYISVSLILDVPGTSDQDFLRRSDGNNPWMVK